MSTEFTNRDASTRPFRFFYLREEHVYILKCFGTSEASEFSSHLNSSNTPFVAYRIGDDISEPYQANSNRKWLVEAALKEGRIRYE